MSCAGALVPAIAHGARPMPRVAHTAPIHCAAPRGEAPPSRSAPPRRELGGRAATTPPPATPAPLATRTAGVAAAGGGAAAAQKRFLHTALRDAGAAACRGPSAPLRSGATKQEERGAPRARRKGASEATRRSGAAAPANAVASAAVSVIASVVANAVGRDFYGSKFASGGVDAVEMCVLLKCSLTSPFYFSSSLTHSPTPRYMYASISLGSTAFAKSFARIAVGEEQRATQNVSWRSACLS